MLEPEFKKCANEIAEYAACEEDVLSYALFPQVATKFFEERRGKSSDATEADVTRELYVEDLTE